jgi:hypothetical protein
VFINDLSRIGGGSYLIGGPYLTENKFDFYIRDLGFFLLYDGINDNYYLTRNGNFSYDFRGFLINEDGYYILNTDNLYVSVIDIDFESSDFSDVFLLVLPINETNLYITDKYIIASQYMPITGVKVFNNFLEAMPFSLDSLLEKAMLEIDDNRDFENKEALIDILYKRYFEILNSRKVMASDYYIKLLNKIEIFERELKN